LCTFAAVEEVALSKIYENTRLIFAVIIRPRRAFLQFLHHNHIQPPLADFDGASFRASLVKIEWHLRAVNTILGTK
jgi:hypothetical protein